MTQVNWAKNIQANEEYPCETCDLLNKKGHCTLDKKEYLRCMLGEKKRHSIKSDTKRTLVSKQSEVEI